LERIAITHWVIRHGVFLFYGNGGLFKGEAVERWYAALHGAAGLRLYVGGAGSVFSFDPVVRARATEWFKSRNLPFAVVTENPMLRVLGATARLLGMELDIYSWSESKRPFQKLGLSAAIVAELNQSLLSLRREVDDEVEQRRPG
jgi:hypothetical protein